MNKIVLVSCSRKKLSRAAKAEHLYAGPLFLASVRYARLLRPKRIFILSAKHGLVGLDQKIRPYDRTLKTMSAEERKAWAATVLKKLRKEADTERDTFIFLAGKKYREHIVDQLAHYEIPLKNKGLGEQLHYLNTTLEEAS